MKRVVTGHRSDGKSEIRRTGDPLRVIRLDSLASLEFIELWATEGPVSQRGVQGDPAQASGSLVPAPGGSRFRLVTLPPDSAVMAALMHSPDPGAPMREIREKLPGFGDGMDSLDPAMHSTPTLDYGIVLHGEVTMEMDGGDTVALSEGDCVIQQGTRHAWRNRSDRPCTIAFIMLGAS